MSFSATAAPASVEAAPERRLVQRAHYVVGPLYDWLFFLAPPALAMVLGLALAGSAFSDETVLLWGREGTWAGVVIGVIIHAHLVLVFVRSHGNAEIHRLHPMRFVWVPIGLYVLLVASSWALVAAAVVATFWDVYHSGMQTFGFARMYDRRAGNDPEVGRRLDLALNQLLYAGPILAGATLMDHVEDLHDLESVGTLLFQGVPGWMEGQQAAIRTALLGFGSLFLLGYVLAYRRHARRGYRVSWLKVYLLVSTGAVSLVAWGFNPFGQAFFIMNLFHAVQYFGIVWAFEGRSVTRQFGATGLRHGGALAAALLALLAVAYGIWVESLDGTSAWLMSVTLVVSLLHFWYDGFIWSVRKRQA